MPAKLGSEERGRDPDTPDTLAERLEASRARRLQERDSAARASKGTVRAVRERDHR